MQPSTGAKAAHIVPLGSHITSLRFCSKRDALAVTASKLTGNIWSGSFFVLGAKADIVQRVEVDHGCSALSWSLHNDNALFVATDDGLIRLWNMEKVHMQRAFDGHNDIITGIAVDPFMHTRFASASYDRTIKVWNADSKADLAELMLDAHNDCVTLVDWNPKTAGVLASGGWDALRLWDVRTKDGKATHFDASSKVLTLGWSSEWLLYYGTEYGAIASLDVRNLSAATATAQVPGDLPVRTLRVNPHDTEQFAAGGDNASTTVYSKSLEKIYGYNGHTDFVATVDWSRAQPGQLASGGFDKSVHLWSN